MVTVAVRLLLALGLFVAAAAPTFAADPYPSRPVRLIVAFGAGGTNDVLARLLAQWLTDSLGQAVVVENRPGAGSNIGTEFVVRAPPDGYTLLLVSTANTINATLYDKLGFSFARDIAPVAGVVRVPLVMDVSPSNPAQTVAEFIANAKANPGKINFASSGIGSSLHVAGELFKMMAGIDMVHVPYRSAAAAMTDLLAGQVQVMFDPLPSSVEQIRAGRVRALAVTTATRSPALPNVPTMSEFVPGYEASGWVGIGAPKDTPPEVIARLNAAVNAGLSDPRLAARLSDLGGMLLPGTPADLGRLIGEETEKWARVIRFSGARAQ